MNIFRRGFFLNNLVKSAFHEGLNKIVEEKLVGRTGIPFFGVDVENLPPGKPVVIDDRVLGSPVENMRDIPPGEYFVQALFNVYTRFERSDGKVVWKGDVR